MNCLHLGIVGCLCVIVCAVAIGILGTCVHMSHWVDIHFFCSYDNLKMRCHAVNVLAGRAAANNILHTAIYKNVLRVNLKL